MKPQARDTIAERIRLHGKQLTAAEHKLVDALLANYPVAGLSSITELAAGRVSAHRQYCASQRS